VVATIERARSGDLDEILALLGTSGLPLDGLHDHLDTALVARDHARIVGSAALERYADGVLLRSVAVLPECRGRRHGRDLTEAAIRLAQECRAPAIYLLTTTAEDFFRQYGFDTISRDDVPTTVQRSVEFRSACPASATVMRKWL
jgi:N-acetylglutamate synthase-like GNAT family acetyltransferase